MNFHCSKMQVFLVFMVALTTVHCVPYYNTEESPGNQNLETHSSPPKPSNRRITIESVLGRKRGQAGDADPQTKNDLRILSLFEHELNHIFSCYVRLSCPRTRSAKVIEECKEIKDWPLYHQVMKMAGIKRYPYQNYAPQFTVTTPTSSQYLTSDDIHMNEVNPDSEEVSTTIRPRTWRQRRQRRNHFQSVSENQ